MRLYTMYIESIFKVYSKSDGIPGGPCFQNLMFIGEILAEGLLGF